MSKFYVTKEITCKLENKGYPFITIIHSGDGEYKTARIDEVLAWLREEKKMHLCVDISGRGWFYVTSPIITKDGKEVSREYEVDNRDFADYNFAAIAGIEYCLDNLI